MTAVLLKSGAHASPSEGLCVMEAAAWLAGEAHTDHPACVSVVIAAFCRSWNDALPTDADRDELSWCGWPDGIAKLSDCEVVSRATDEQHQKFLAMIAQSPGRRGDRARATLAAPRGKEGV